MKILFNAFSEMCKIYCKIAHLMEKYNDINVDKYYFLIESTVFENYIKENAPQNKSEIIYTYKNFDVNKLGDVNLERLKKYEKYYGIPNLWFYIVADRFFRRYDEKRILKALNWHIEFYENLFDKHKIDVLISADIGGLYSGVMHRIAEEKSVINFKILSSRLPEPSRIYISDDLYLKPKDIHKHYENLLNRNLTNEELKKAKEIVDLYRNKKSTTAAMSAFKLKKTQYLNTTKNIFRKIINFKFKGIKNIQTPLDIIKNSVFIVKIRSFILKKFYNSLFENPDFNEKYYYYPLHVQPERSIDLIAPFYMDQIYLIENIANCMPIEYKLYVKEHPGFVGMRSIKYYKRLRKIPRVKLIKTEYDNHTLIKNSTGITTITGTVGWEGLIFGKPVISFGHVFYNLMKDSVFFVKDFYNLPYLFQEIISNFKPNEEKILKFCYAKYLSTYPGSMMPPSMDKFATSNENINNLYKVIINEIKKRKDITH